MVGDFDGRQGDDIFWYAAGTAADYIWYSNAGRVDQHVLPVTARYAPFSGDLDGNGTDDMFWYTPGSGADSSGSPRHPGAFHSVSRTVTKSYLPAAADFDDGGTDDVVWFSPSVA